MKPVPQSQLNILKPLFSRIVREGGLSELTSEETMLGVVEQGYEMRTLDAYVNDLNDPTSMVILALHPSMWLEGLSVSVLSIYTLPEKRGDKEQVKAMMNLIELYAQLKGARFITGGKRSFYKDGKASNMWEKSGYAEHETTFIKILE